MSNSFDHEIQFINFVIHLKIGYLIIIILETYFVNNIKLSKQ